MSLNSEITVPVPPTGESISINLYLDQLEEGGTLYLQNGIYLLNTQILITKNVRMVGKGGTKTILQGEQFDFLLIAKNVAKLILHGIGLIGVGQQKTNIFSFTGGELELEDCVISGAKSLGNARFGSGLGAVINSDKRVTISGCSFENNDQTGLSLGDKTVAKITNSNFESNMYGIKLSDRSSAFVSECQFVGNSYSGLSSMSAGLVWVKTCKIHGNGSGLEILVKAQVEVKDCDILDNERGIYISDNSKCVAEKNRLYQNMQPIIMSDFATGEFSHNNIYENTQTGISLNGNSKSVFRYNTIHDNDFFEVGLSENAETIFNKNSFSQAHKEETEFFLVAGRVKAEIIENFFFTSPRPLIYITDITFLENVLFQGNYNTRKREIFLEEYSSDNEIIKLFLMTIKSPEEKVKEKEKKIKAATQKSSKAPNKNFTGDEWREYNENLDADPIPDFVFKNVELSGNPDTKRFVLFKKTSLLMQSTD